MVPPRKRKMVQSSPATATFSIGNCIVEFPSDADQEFTTEKLSLQVNQFASVKISVDKSKIFASETPSPCNPGAVDKSKVCVSETPSPYNSGYILPLGLSFQLINPKSLDKINNELLESTTKLYKQELPAMSFAADTGKESDFLRNCTMSGKYCSLLLKKPGDSPADPEIVVGAITYQILPTSTQYAEIPLAAVDQSCQRQGLGKLIVRELAKRLKDVGVLTLFCWGDQESEMFWNKQGFLKIAEVDAQGKPQKLRLKNEIRKAMSLPGNSALMVCNLPHSNNAMYVSVGETTHQTSGPNSATPTIEKEVKSRRRTSHAGAEQSPIASSDVFNLSSFRDNPCKTPLCSDVSPALAVTSTPCPNRDISSTAVKTYVRGYGSKLPVTTNPIIGCMSSPAKSNRTLRFPEIDRVATTGEDISESAPPVFSDQLVTSVAFDNAGPVVKSCTTKTSEEKVTATSSIDNPSKSAVESREPLGNVENVVAPVKKRPWKRTKCDSPKVAAAIEGPESTDAGCGPGKENRGLARKEISGTECDGSVDTLESGLKRPRAEIPPGKALGRRSVRRRRCDSPSIVNPVFQTSEPQFPEPPSISEQDSTTRNAGTPYPVFRTPEPRVPKPSSVSTVRKAGSANPVFQTPEPRVPKPSSVSTIQKAGSANAVFQTPEPRVPKPASIPEQISTAQKAGTVSHGAVHNGQIGSATRDAKVVDCKQSMADGSFSPSSLGEEHLNLRMQTQGKDSTIRKRLSTRLVHVSEAGEDSGYLKDFAKATTPVVFIMNMPNDPKKRALAQFGQLVEKLGGKVTGDGGECTHVVTSEVRRTLNFCTALCNGAWVVTPDWLKASSRHKSFVEEESYLLRDKQFESKYKVSLTTAIQAAQRKPRSLFAGFSVYPTPHVQPPLDIVTKLTKVAGGKILSSLDEALQQNDPSHTIVLTCDEDKEEGDVAAKAGLHTFTGEWLMQAIVKQTIDFDTIIPSDH